MKRQAANQFIKTSGDFDAVLDSMPYQQLARCPPGNLNDIALSLAMYPPDEAASRVSVYLHLQRILRADVLSTDPRERAMHQCPTSSEKDLLGSRWATWLLWIGPWVLIVSTSNTGNITHAIAWTFGFTVGGVACLVNARRCGRLHCFYTGPLYLLAALASLLYGLRILPLGHHGWDWILGTAAAVSLLACCGLEMLLGKYKTRHAT